MVKTEIVMAPKNVHNKTENLAKNQLFVSDASNHYYTW